MLQTQTTLLVTAADIPLYVAKNIVNLVGVAISAGIEKWANHDCDPETEVKKAFFKAYKKFMRKAGDGKITKEQFVIFARSLQFIALGASCLSFRDERLQRQIELIIRNHQKYSQKLLTGDKRKQKISKLAYFTTNHIEVLAKPDVSSKTERIRVALQK